MDKIKTVKIKNLDGSISQETYTIAVDAKNVDMLNGKDVQDTIGNIDIDNNGNIAEQLNTLKNSKINITDIEDNLISNETNKVLSARQGKILKDSINILEENVFMNDIVVNKYYDDVSSTIYYITEIPYHNEKGEQNVWKIGIAHDDITLSSKQSTLDFAKSKNASICINSARGISRLGGILIKDGVILNSVTTTTLGKILGIKPDGSFTFFPVDTPAQTVLESGCINALVAFDTFIENGEAVPYDHGNGLEPNPRQVICRKTNGDYLIFTCNGREQYDVGMTVADMQRILLARNDIDCAYNLDGGGSTSTVIDLQKINKDIDDHYEDREVVVFLYMDKTDKNNKDITNIYKIVSDLRQEINEKLVNLEVLSGKLKLFADGNNPDIEFYNNGERTNYDGRLRLNNAGLNIKWRPDDESEEIDLLSATEYFLRFKNVPFGEFMNYCTNNASETDLDKITKQGFYIATSNTAHVPRSATFVVLHINSSSNYDVQQQIAFPLGANGYIYARRKLSGSNVWNNWAPINFYIGNTNGRPTTNLIEGIQYYDTTLGKPIWYNGTNWIDATGNQV